MHHPLVSPGLPGLALALVAALGSATPSLAAAEPVPFRVPAGLPDALEVVSPSAVQLDGFLGPRVSANARQRLAQVNLDTLSIGFRQKPGSHPWIGEHIGKWMHAATLAWAYTGDVALRQRLDYAAAELVKAQESDGYLGTYVPEKRFGLFPGADWDVWSHKYNLLGLLTYHQYTGDAAALEASRRMGDLLLATFGPGRKSILAAGTHVGMAATSVLEPMVLLYRFTGDGRYLEFCRYLVNAWDEPNGPRIVATLLSERRVDRTANGKAYEMLSNLVGLCELARVTGDRSLLTPVLNAWEDIVARRRYVTGSASQGEHFHGDHDLPNGTGAHVAETCVTTTWIQLNLQLLRLTGEARFGSELERTFYNHLAAAQRPDGAEWCYFTALEGTKPYGPGINCCVSSGPRGMALVPQSAFLRYRSGTNEGVALNLFEPGRVTLTLGGQPVTIEQRSAFPRKGGAELVAALATPTAFALRIRAADWAGPLRVRINDRVVKTSSVAGWVEVPSRLWRQGDRVRVDYRLGPRIILGEHGNAGKVALTWGPFVLAYDQQRNRGLPPSAGLALAHAGGSRPFAPQSGDELRFVTAMRTPRDAGKVEAIFVPFAEAGKDGGFYRVWVWAAGRRLSQPLSLLLDGVETRSRAGNQGGSINDGDPASFVVTFDGKPADEDWYAVTLGAPVRIARVRFAHGQTFHDGGWFDTTQGRPTIQVRRTQGGSWEAVASLAGYPATTAVDSGGLTAGQMFEVRLAQPVTAAAVRVVGRPACGDNPAQAFSSCGELEALAD